MTGSVLRLVLGLFVLNVGTSALAESSRPAIPDVQVIDQDGQPHQLYSDLIKGNTVAITFLFTSCKTSCPAMTGLFSAVQDKLQGTARPPVTFLSISIDPVTDRPAQLKVLANQFGAKPGWYFVTGTTSDIARVLTAFDAQSSRRADHPSVMLIGNDVTGNWTRHVGLASVLMVMDLIDSVTASVSSH